MIGMNLETFLGPAALVWSVWFGVLASGHDSEKPLGCAIYTLKLVRYCVAGLVSCIGICLGTR